MADVKTAIVTGGTGALGSVIASAFLNKGMQVAIPTRTAASTVKIPQELKQFADRLMTAEAEISRESSAREFAREVLRHFGSIDVLVNTAGGYAGGEMIGEVSGATLESMLSANLNTTFMMCSAVLPAMRKAKTGRIINIAASAALNPGVKRGPYAIAKRAVVTLTETIAEEVKGTGITANAIAPSIIVTDANRESMPSADTSRWVTPQEIAAIVLFLCSDGARSVNGNVLKVFGGV
ncbi:MAG TPA: SDR family NAD(P)-dependent oxidoreductase [Bacteroidota bacterium]|nr:SDR family NAD(P)-dependent oxidoreductase [Bacteroidota bacterium]